jgi:hypothetical protein
MFGVKEEEVKVRKPRKKAVPKKKTESDVTKEASPAKKPRRKAAPKKKLETTEDKETPEN